MTEETVFYHNPQSRSQMAHWMLKEAAAPYKIVPIDFAKGENRAPAFLTVNPMDKLPTIVHRSYEEVVATLKAALDNGPYLLGDRLSAADVYIGSQIRFAMMFGASGLKGEKVFDDYVARLSARPAAQRTAGG